jgi:hypothetical protein
MNNIRQLTLEEHKTVKSEPFVSILMSGQILLDLYSKDFK